MIRIRLNWEENATKLAASLMESLIERAIIPILKNKEIILDDSSAMKKLKTGELYDLLIKSLREGGISYENITLSEEEIIVNDLKPREGKTEPKIYICPHCGFITPYEEEFWNHVKIHYLGF